MSLWLKILNVAADGDEKTANFILNVELVEDLRFRVITSDPNKCSYDGPVAKAVMNFVRSLYGTPDYELAWSRSEDFIDYIVDLIVAKIQRTVALVQFCRRFPELGIKEVANTFSGWAGLKRNRDYKINYVAQNLYSMKALGVCLSDSVAMAEIAKQQFDITLGFEERALVKGWEIGRSWKDFVRQEELHHSYIAIDKPLDGNEGTAYESVDLGYVPESKLSSNYSFQNIANEYDFMEIGVAVTADLNSILEEFHSNKPHDGYRPIAWHNVWWHIYDKYIALALGLRGLDPVCDTDSLLAQHIAAHYPEILKVTRLNIQRRRSSLTVSCESHIVGFLREQLVRH